MRYGLQFRGYKRKFLKPVRLGVGMQFEREGALLRLESDDGIIGFGEIAPIEAFGSESLKQSLEHLKSFHGVIRSDSIVDAPTHFPCTRYALGCALNAIDQKRENPDFAPDGWGEPKVVQSAQLIMATEPESSIASGIVKVKIASGNESLEHEIETVIAIAHRCMLSGAKLRLDANEHLSADELMRWVDALVDVRDTVEFIEQPFDRWLIQETLEVATRIPIPIAFDESIPMLREQGLSESDLKRHFFVLKPSLGDLDFSNRLSIPLECRVFSSVFETAVGFSQLLELGPFELIPGFGTQDYFEDAFVYPNSGSNQFETDRVDHQQLWDLLK